MRQIWISALVLATLLGAGCNSPTDTEFTGDGIVGRWKWVFTYLPWRQGIEYPPMGDELVATFTANKVYTEVLNGQLVRSTTYSLSSESDSTGNLVYDDTNYTAGFSVRSDTLRIGNPEVDGPLQVYVRTR